eukprot:UN23920
MTSFTVASKLPTSPIDAAKASTCRLRSANSLADTSQLHDPLSSEGEAVVSS